MRLAHELLSYMNVLVDYATRPKLTLRDRQTIAGKILFSLGREVEGG